jgi:putative two-component system response regulator
MFRILAVDDEPFNLDLIELAFSETSEIAVESAIDGKSALEKIYSNTPQYYNTILLDLSMPVKNGFEVLKELKNSDTYRFLPIIVITANNEEKHNALKLGANDFLSKPVDIVELKSRTLNYCKLSQFQYQLSDTNKLLEEKVKERTLKLQEALEIAKETEHEISERLGKASEFRDIETGMHIKRMSHYSAKLAELAGLPEDEVELILHASPLHDIGKVGIPDKILLKPGRFEGNEFEIMKLHTIIGGKILEGAEKYPVINAGKIIALQHHEKIDGTGYPYGLKGNEIHIYAKIVAIADVFDALTSKRVYKPALDLDVALKIMKDGSNTHFDSKLLDLFLNNLNDFLEIKEKFKDESNELPSILKLIEEERD